MSKKSAHIAQIIAGCHNQDLEAHYLGFFQCFNRGLFYESHDVLEELWLQDRLGPDGNFFKGLIQFAGAFVHLQKHSTARPRLKASGSLFKLSRGYLQPYAPLHRRLDVARVLGLIAEWLEWLEQGEFKVNPLGTHAAPQLSLHPGPKP